MNEHQDNSYIPDPSEAGVPVGSRGWRAVDGHLCRGQDKNDPNWETIDKLFGRFKKIGEVSGTNKDGVFSRRLVLELATNTGTERLSVQFYRKGPKEEKYSQYTQFFGLARAVQGLDVDELFSVVANRGNKPYEGTTMYPTFLNFYRYKLLEDGSLSKPGEIRPPRGERSTETPGAQIEAMLVELKKHPAWAEFAKPADPNSHRAKFDEDCKAKGWPTATEAPDAWRALFKQLGKDMDSFDEDTWGEARLSFQNRSAEAKANGRPDPMPKIVQLWVEEHNWTPSADEVDPFAGPGQMNLDDI